MVCEINCMTTLLRETGSLRAPVAQGMSQSRLVLSIVAIGQVTPPSTTVLSL